MTGLPDLVGSAHHAAPPRTRRAGQSPGMLIASGSGRPDCRTFKTDTTLADNTA
ncbi:hypothetical protein [Xanthomonas sp. D-109]|uniref:hypothetical protein n=1 Tax=Xanthomonas sp. D-109 TaxID=2821274 RepID=UPI001ADA5CFD|nr:hypothetical protein [Xanthomonas sp. D-109]MBO9881748.1 hypothetical protein [Xanthomonas sp. D-109]